MALTYMCIRAESCFALWRTQIGANTGSAGSWNWVTIAGVKPMKIDIDDEFEDFMRKIHPTVGAHTAQYRESRRVWFAATANIFYLLHGKVADLPEDEGLQVLTDLGEQLLAFTTKIGFNV